MVPVHATSIDVISGQNSVEALFLIADVHVTLVQEPVSAVAALAVPTKNNAHKPTFKLGKNQGVKTCGNPGIYLIKSCLKQSSLWIRH